MKTMAKYSIFCLIGAAGGAAGYSPLWDWQWWAWAVPMMTAVHARDWVMRA